MIGPLALCCCALYSVLLALCSVLLVLGSVLMIILPRYQGVKLLDSIFLHGPVGYVMYQYVPLCTRLCHGRETGAGCTHVCM